MAFLAESMKSLADDILLSANQRAEAITSLKEATAQTRSQARDLIQSIHRSQRQAADELSRRMEADRQRRSEQVRSLLTAIASARRDMRSRCHDELAAARSQRQKQVEALLQASRDAQQQIANDLRHAAKTWRGMAQARAGHFVPARNGKSATKAK